MYVLVSIGDNFIHLIKYLILIKKYIIENYCRFRELNVLYLLSFAKVKKITH